MRQTVSRSLKFPWKWIKGMLKKFNLIRVVISERRVHLNDKASSGGNFIPINKSKWPVSKANMA